MKSVLLVVALASLAPTTGKPEASSDESRTMKLKHLEKLKEELEAKKNELATLEHDEAAAKARAEEIKAQAKPKAVAAVSTEAMSDADRLLKGLDQIRNLRTTFAADDHADQFSGAMGYELAHGDSIWSAIEQLTTAAAGAKANKTNATLESAMATFTKVIGTKLHEVDVKDNVQNEEYVLGLLAHHRDNVTEQRQILSNFTSLPAVKTLLANHKSGEFSGEFADILDSEHPAAKPLTSFLQRVM